MSPLTLLARSRLFWSRIPWMRVWVISVWLVRKARDRLEKNLSSGERQELLNLMRKSKGRRRNLTGKDEDRFRSLVRKAVLGERK
jgi:hypothetical protein